MAPTDIHSFAHEQPGQESAEYRPGASNPRTLRRCAVCAAHVATTCNACRRTLNCASPMLESNSLSPIRTHTHTHEHNGVRTAMYAEARAGLHPPGAHSAQADHELNVFTQVSGLHSNRHTTSPADPLRRTPPGPRSDASRGAGPYVFCARCGRCRRSLVCVGASRRGEGARVRRR